MGVVLTEEEFLELSKHIDPPLNPWRLVIARAQARKQYLWGEELCSDHPFLRGSNDKVVPIPRKLCHFCVEELRKELGC